MVRLSRVEEVAKEFIATREEAGKSWYKVDETDIQVVSETEGGPVRPLSVFSPMINSLKATRRVSLYARPEHVAQAITRIAEFLQGTL